MKKPNIIMIMSDQHRGDCLGIDGNAVIQTPNIDNFAYEGAWFSRAYTTCPSCIAARRSLLTGQYPKTHGMRGYNDLVPWANAPQTAADVLKRAGYHTYFVGREMHQLPTRARHGYDHMELGADYLEWFAERVPGSVHLPWNDPRHSAGIRNNDWTVHPWNYDENLHFTNWTAARAREFLAKRDPEAPYFLTVSFLAPHPPLSVPQFYFDRYLRNAPPDPSIGDWEERPPERGIDVSCMRGLLTKGTAAVVLEGERKVSALAAYYGLINHIDDQIRSFINESKGADLDNTLIIYTSDHGELLGDHYQWRKQQAYEGSARIPFVIRLPNSFDAPRNNKIDTPVCLEDIMPTILDIAGEPIPDTVEGKSLLPLLMGQTDTLGREYIPIEHAPYHQSMTDERWKYIRFVLGGEEQLFDLTADPHELHNLASKPEYSDIIKLWRARMVRELEGREEGFIENGEFVPGRYYPTVWDK